MKPAKDSKIWALTVGWVAAALVCSCPAFGGATFLGLGDLPGGGFFSEARGVSANGMVVVGASESGTLTGSHLKYSLFVAGIVAVCFSLIGAAG